MVSIPVLLSTQRKYSIISAFFNKHAQEYNAFIVIQFVKLRIYPNVVLNPETELHCYVDARISVIFLGNIIY